MLNNSTSSRSNNVEANTKFHCAHYTTQLDNSQQNFDQSGPSNSKSLRLNLNQSEISNSKFSRTNCETGLQQLSEEEFGCKYRKIHDNNDISDCSTDCCKNFTEHNCTATAAYSDDKDQLLTPEAASTDSGLPDSDVCTVQSWEPCSFSKSGNEHGSCALNGECGGMLRCCEVSCCEEECPGRIGPHDVLEIEETTTCTEEYTEFLNYTEWGKF